MKKGKCDNRSLPLKLKLRRWTLDALAEPALKVLDLCAGEGHIWKALRESYHVESYTPCDREPRMPGCIKGEAERLIEAFDLSNFNVIDIDVYGEPWPIWLRAMTRISRPTAVFMTAGSIKTSFAGIHCTQAALRAVGIPDDWFKGRVGTRDVPGKLALVEFVNDWLLNNTATYLDIQKAGKIVTRTNNDVTYYGLVCSPKIANIT